MDCIMDNKLKYLTIVAAFSGMSFTDGGDVVESPKEGTKDKMNVLFIAIDDLKPLLNSYGSSQMHTPNIDKLASKGMIFTNAHCQQAVSGPTRASLLPGMRPDYTGVWDLKTRMRDVNPDILAMPEYYQQNGYETVAIGKIYDPRCVDKQYDKPSWSIPYSESSKYNYPAEYGEPVLSYYASPKSKEIAQKLRNEAKEKGISNVNEYLRANYKPSTESADVPDDAMMDGQICNNALNYMDQLSKSDKPFFLAVGFKRPHLPFAAPKKYWDLYDRDKIELAEYQGKVKNGVDIAYHKYGELRAYTDIPQLEEFTDIFKDKLPVAKQEELIHGYYACVSFIDAQVGRLMDKLEETGLAKNTVVVLWGDHGWHLGDHALWCKHTNFEQATRVPLIFSLPEQKQTGEYKHPVEFLDIFPTLCEATGLKTPEQLQGKSLIPAMENPDKEIKAYAVSQFSRGDKMGYSIRTNRYRLTVWMKNHYRSYLPFDKKLIYDCELYDYEKDPNETVNLYRSKDHKKVVNKLLQHFKDFVATQNKELLNAGCNPKKAKKISNTQQMFENGNFEKPLRDSWEVTARKGAETEFVIVAESPVGKNALKVDVKKLGEKPWDIIMISKHQKYLEAGTKATLSLDYQGGKMKIALISSNGNSIRKVESGNGKTQKINFKIDKSGEYKFKIQFETKGIYYLDNLKISY